MASIARFLTLPLAGVARRVKWFNTQKGFGFITPDDGSEEIFVHQTAIHSEGFRSLREVRGATRHPRVPSVFSRSRNFGLLRAFFSRARGRARARGRGALARLRSARARMTRGNTEDTKPATRAVSSVAKSRGRPRRTRDHGVSTALPRHRQRHAAARG